MLEQNRSLIVQTTKDREPTVLDCPWLSKPTSLITTEGWP
jgi:hypothetical protein